MLHFIDWQLIRCHEWANRTIQQFYWFNVKINFPFILYISLYSFLFLRIGTLLFGSILICHSIESWRTWMYQEWLCNGSGFSIDLLLYFLFGYLLNRTETCNYCRATSLFSYPFRDGKNFLIFSKNWNIHFTCYVILRSLEQKRIENTLTDSYSGQNKFSHQAKQRS